MHQQFWRRLAAGNHLAKGISMEVLSREALRSQPTIMRECRPKHEILGGFHG